MSVRVNLLPREIEERNRAARQRTGLAAAGLALVVLLVAGYVMQLGRVNDAREELEAQQAEVSRLQAEVSSLNEFQQLEQREQASATLLASALGSESSVAGVLQDVAAVMPADTELTSLNVSLAGETAPALGETRPTFGSLTLAGQTIKGHAPGLERFLLEFEKVASFTNVFFSSSTVDDAGVSTFNVDLQLGPEIFTRRYVNGLPEELR